jgi:hypothetical protein
MSNQSASQPESGLTGQYSHITFFLANLRLLSLDQRSDWPSINPETFSTKNALQNQKNRVRCVEWALFRLFEIWDPKETQEVGTSFGPVDELLMMPRPETGALFPSTIAAASHEPSSRVVQGSQPAEERWKVL